MPDGGPATGRKESMGLLPQCHELVAVPFSVLGAYSKRIPDDYVACCNKGPRRIPETQGSIRKTSTVCDSSKQAQR